MEFWHLEEIQNEVNYVLNFLALEERVLKAR
jgi:hypothetical protein